MIFPHNDLEVDFKMTFKIIYRIYLQLIIVSYLSDK